MPLGISWCTVEDAAAKYCLKTSLILKWVEEGVVRAEQTGTRITQINVDDLELKVQEMTKI